MPKDESPDLTPAADAAEEEVIDLLEVVRPGRQPAQEPGADDADFTEDLENMLDSLSQAETETQSPMPDPTPVGYAVDHDESLDLPDMDDLDEILDSLGTDTREALEQASVKLDEPESAASADDLAGLDAVPAAPAAQEQAAPDPLDDAFLDSLLQDGEAAGPRVDESAPPADAGGSEDIVAAGVLPEDIDALLAAGEPPSPADAPEESAAPPPAAAAASGEDAEELLAEASAGAEPLAPPPVAAEEVASPSDEAAAAPGGDAPGDKPDAEAAPEDAAVSPLEEIDLVELDALLDDVLAGAPAPGPAPASVEQPAPAGSGAPLADLESAPNLVSEIASLRREVESLRDDLNESLSLARATPTGDETDDIKALLESQSAALAAHGARIEDLELTLAAKAGEGDGDSLQAHGDRISLLEGRIEALEDCSDRIQALEGRLGDLEEQFAAMQGGLDKLAAEAAARVIREELAALMAQEA